MNARLVYWQTATLFGLLVALFGDGPIVRVLGALMAFGGLFILGVADDKEWKNRR